MRINDNIGYYRLYFILGDAPAGQPRNQVKDGPSGYCSAYVINQDRIFVPSLGRSWFVDPDCPELSKLYDLNSEMDVEDMARRIKKSIADAIRLGLNHDVEAANIVLEALNVKPIHTAKPVSVKPVAKPVAKPVSVKREGLRSIKDAEEELGLKGRVIRGILREAGIVKPAEGWCGDDKWLSSVLEIVRRTQA
jgi:hypothetical protein